MKTQFQNIIVNLAVAKRDTVERLLSKALKDQNITDTEHTIILHEIDRYRTKRRSTFKVNKKAKQKQITQPLDIEKILMKEIRHEVREELKKRIGDLV